MTIKLLIDPPEEIILQGLPSVFDRPVVVIPDTGTQTMSVIKEDGPQGPPGGTGIVKVNHGDDGDVPRPDAPLVYWVGAATPVNADPDDFWKDS